MADYVLAIDQGTTSTRAIVFDHAGKVVVDRPARARADLPEGRMGRARPGGDLAQRPRGDRPGAVEGRHHPARHRRGRHHQPARDDGRLGQDDRQARLQRDRLAGHAHPVDRRPPRGATAASSASSRRSACRCPPTSPAPRSSGSSRTSTAPARRRTRGELLFGTTDTWVLWNLTGGTDGGVHVTDVTNASPHAVHGPRDLPWDDEILEAFGVPRSMLPEIRSSSEVYGTVESVDACCARCRSPASSATSRPRPSARRRSRPARRRTPTAPATS